MVYSLCHYLNGGTKLRFLTVDVQRLHDHCAMKGKSEQYEELVRVALYPLRMLGASVEVHVQGAGSVSGEQILQPSQVALQMARGMVNGSAWTTIMRIEAASRLVSRLGTATILPYPYLEDLAALSDGLAIGVFGIGLVVDMLRLRQLSDYLHKVLLALRDAWENLDANLETKLQESIKQQMYEMLFFGVELERALKEKEERGE
jgi:hypothetical protein